MPELPEVETTRRGIATVMPGQVLKALNIFESRLRWPIPADLPGRVGGNIVRSCQRRGKYLLIEFDAGVMIVHLGMSGSLRRVSLTEPVRKHDHVEWVFDDARFLLHDPRRFGAVLWHDLADGPVESHPLLAKLGIEPFDANFTAEMLYERLQGKTQSIKQALLAGNIVVGVGNIYASESLFRAGINPKITAGSLSRARCKTLWASIRSTLSDALSSGGSTLRDYVNATGAPGSYFDVHAAVYDRAGTPCRVCGTLIKRIVQGQRATYYCPTCQRR